MGEWVAMTNCCSEGAFDVVLRLLDEVRADSDPVIIGRYQSALQWMKERFALQGDRRKRMLWLKSSADVWGMQNVLNRLSIRWIANMLSIFCPYFFCIALHFSLRRCA
mgnify:CR=1 FL=1